MKLLRRKLKGESTLIASLFCVFAMFVVFLALFLNYAQMVKQNQVERVYRQYLLRMEKEGYLTAADEAALTAELTALGVENIDLSDTSVSAVGYGNEVRLHIVGDLKVESIGFSGENAERQEGVVHIDIDRTGTALY